MVHQDRQSQSLKRASDVVHKQCQVQKCAKVEQRGMLQQGNSTASCKNIYCACKA